MDKERADKKQKFTQQKKSTASVYLAFAVMTLAVAVGGYFFLNSKNPLDAKSVASVNQKINYSTSEQLQQTKVPSKIENGRVIVTSLSTLKNDKFIWTEYKAGGKRVPLTAVIQPNGKVLVAVSVCEPCNSETFHITGNKLICNACGTVWDLQTLKGDSGGCQQYPPDALTYSVNGDNLEVPQSTLDNWKPRV
ncbi:DUF2318 domain-containing protein [Paradesulfitobacterium aromaticivorans]